MRKRSILPEKSLFRKIVFDTDEGSLGNTENEFIRKYDFLIREGWSEREDAQLSLCFTYMFMLAGDIVEKHRGKDFNPSKNINQNHEKYTNIHRNVSNNYIERATGNPIKIVPLHVTYMFFASSRSRRAISSLPVVCHGCYSRH